MVIFDSSVLIGALRGDPSSIRAVNFYIGKERAATTVINSYELARGGATDEERRAIELLRDLVIYGIGEAEFGEAKEVYRSLRSAGTMIGELDILIAAIAISNDEILITKDKDFKRIKKCRVRIVQ
jgi:predicted nucleic acid-binding protein